MKLSRIGSVLFSLVPLLGAHSAWAQVYGYTDDSGVLILSNVPNNDRMSLIVDGTTEETGKVWRYNGQFESLILRAASAYQIDASLVRAVIAVESAFNRHARSHKGAQGLMQLMPDTGRQYGVVNPYDPWQNIRAGTAHLRGLLDEFKELRLALAAYNAGRTPVRRYGTVPPYPETRDYVRKVMAIYRAGSKVQIIKGGKMYSIGEPGGRTKITLVGNRGQRAPSTGTTGSPLVDLANKSRARSAARGAATSPPPGPPAQTAPSVQPAQRTANAKLLFYRYVDPEGIIHITRSKPSNYPYEVLPP